MATADVTDMGLGRELRRALDDLAGELDRVSFGLRDEDRPVRDRRLEETRRAIRQRLIPKLDHADLPLFVVLAGGSGVGKSTILNTVVGETVAPTGVVRPTTTVPTIYLHETTREVVAGPAVLPSYEKEVLPADEPAEALDDPAVRRVAIRVHGADDHRPFALVDAPDFDTIRGQNQEIAEELIDLADLVLFVTSPAKYGDDRPWRYVRMAAERGKPMAFVFNRTEPGDREEGGIVDGYRDRLRAAGVEVGEEAPLVVLPEEEGATERGHLGGDAREELAGFLEDRLASEGSRRRLQRRSILAAARSVAAEAATVREDLARESEAIGQMVEEAERVLEGRSEEALREVRREPLVNESLVREIIRERLPHLAQKVAAGVGWLLDRLSFWRRREDRAVRDRMEEVVSANLERKLEVIEKHLRRSHREVETALEGMPRGAWVVRDEGFETLSVDPEALEDDFRSSVGAFRDWLGDEVGELTEGLAWTGRFLYVVDIVTASVMLVIFSHTGGLTGAEIGVAGAASAFESFIIRLGIGEAAFQNLLKRADERYEEIFTGHFTRAEDSYRAYLEGFGAEGSVRSDLAGALEEAEGAIEGFAEASEGEGGE